MGHITVVAFGASTVEGAVQMPDESKRWLNRLKGMLESEFAGISFNVINSGVGGNSAREAMQRFERDVLAHNPDFALILFGGNNNDPENPERRVSPDEFSGYLEEVKQRLPAHTGVIVITFPPLIEEQHKFCGHTYFRDFGGMDKLLNRYRDLTRKFAFEHGLPVADLYDDLTKRMADCPKNYYTLDDGVHLTKEGNRLLAGMVFEILKPMILK